MDTHLNKSMQFKWVPTNICLYKEVDKKYIGSILKTTELLDCALIGICVVIWSNTVYWKNNVIVIIRIYLLKYIMYSKRRKNLLIHNIYESQHWKTYLVHVHPVKIQISLHIFTVIRIFTGHILDSYRNKVSWCRQQRIWLDISLHLAAHMSENMFSHAVAQFIH